MFSNHQHMWSAYLVEAEVSLRRFAQSSWGARQLGKMAHWVAFRIKLGLVGGIKGEGRVGYWSLVSGEKTAGFSLGARPKSQQITIFPLLSWFSTNKGGQIWQFWFIIPPISRSLHFHVCVHVRLQGPCYAHSMARLKIRHSVPLTHTDPAPNQSWLHWFPSSQ